MQLLRIAFVLLLFCNSAFSQDVEFGVTAVSLHNLSLFRPTGGNWRIASDVFYDLKGGVKSKITPGTGILVNDLSGKSKDHLLTVMEHGDIDVELEFMMDRNSNAGVYLQGRYEIQMFDSWGVVPVKSTDCGAIYERWDESRPEGFKGYEGHPPAQNVSKAPGLWQHLAIHFRAPRFNDKGEKIENARFVKVMYNGVTIHENVEVTGPTRAAIFEDEKPSGPLVIQGDHGPVAIRNIRYKAYGPEKVLLSDLKLRAYEAQFNSLDEVNAATPAKEMSIASLEHQGTDNKDQYGGRINGTLHVPKTSTYRFTLSFRWIPANIETRRPNGAGELKIGSKTVIALDAKTTGGSNHATVTLDAGVYPFELVYFKHHRLWWRPGDDITLTVEAPGIALTSLNAVMNLDEATNPIFVPVKNEVTMQRSFLNHGGKKRTHVISVAEPGGVNYAFDLSKGSFLQFWRGDFIETTDMWFERGEPQLAIPLGSVIERPAKPSVALLTDKNVAWPDSTTNYNYSGYKVSQSGRPTFNYSLGAVQISESLESGENGKKLSHTVTVANSSDDVWFNIATGKKIEKLPNGLYAVNDKQFLIQLPDKTEPVLRKSTGDNWELLLPMKTTGKAGSITYSIIW
jgi:hypothetical protein